MLGSSEGLSLNLVGHVADEKSFPPFKIDIFWAMVNSVADLVHTRFLAPLAASTIEPKYSDATHTMYV
jgi:hypothetical protein